MSTVTEVNLNFFEVHNEDEINYSSSRKYNPDIFSSQLDIARREVAMYEKLGKEFKSDKKSAERLVDALTNIDKWFKSYNQVDLTSITEVVKMTRMVQVKVFVDDLDIKRMGFTDVAFAGGVFTPGEVYIIPLSVIGREPIHEFGEGSAKKVLNKLKEIVYEYEGGNPYGLPEDANYGTTKLISGTHIAVVAKVDDHPYMMNATRIHNWRFIHSDGFSL